MIAPNSEWLSDVMAQIIPGTPFSSSSGHRPSFMTEPPVAGSVLDQSRPTVDSIRGLEPAGRMATAGGRVAASRLRIAAPVACRQGQRILLLAAADPSLHGIEIAVEFLDAAEYGREVGLLTIANTFCTGGCAFSKHDPPGPFGHDLLGGKDRAQTGAANVLQVRDIEDEDVHGLMGELVQLTVKDPHALMIEASVEMYRCRKRTVGSIGCSAPNRIPRASLRAKTTIWQLKLSCLF